MARIIDSFNQTTLAVSLTLVLFSCNGNTSTEKVASSIKSSKAVPDSSLSSSLKNMDKKDQIALARTDLSIRRGVELTAVTLSNSKEVTWRSGALGCPEPGINYTQALVPGFAITLHVGNTEFRYHARQGGQPFYCPDDQVEAPIKGAGSD